MCTIFAHAIDSRGMNDSGFGEIDRTGESQRSEAGAESACQEAERRRQERRARVLARHPRIGWLLLALAGAQAHGEGWRGGIREEESARPERGETS
jgi:hypothetical protein